MLMLTLETVVLLPLLIAYASAETSATNEPEAWLTRGCPHVEPREDTRNRETLSRDDVLRMKSRGCTRTLTPPSCQRNQCYNEKFRTQDGTCNNLRRSTNGAAFRAADRLYSPVTNRSRVQASPREASRILLQSQYEESSQYNSLFMQWGQFVAHDITRTVDFEDGRRYDCGQCNRASTCSRIPVSSTDNKYSQRCIQINATVPVCNAQEERYNENTAFIDASMIYGSSLKDSQTVRSGMWLRTERYRGKDLPVLDRDDMFIAGDSRQNIFIGLAALHTLFVRQHNRIASQLARMNPRWNPDRVFQETRKIIGAIIQKITYEEFLPRVLGPSIVRQLGRYRYKSNESNPQIKLEFSTASYRFGHGMIRSRYPLIDDYWRRIQEYPTTDAMFNNTLLLRYGIDAVLRGLLVTPAKKPQSMSRDVTERLFGDKDLASTNIQRGRDHHIPGYASVRNSCGLGRLRSFDDLTGVFANRDAISKLKQVYSNVDDIDLFVGSMLESPSEGALVGPTTACILRKQFQALRVGDRFFYENTDIFTSAQIREIRCSSLAAVICDNSDGLYSVPSDAFAVTSSRSLQRCNRIVRPDFYQWKER